MLEFISVVKLLSLLAYEAYSICRKYIYLPQYFDTALKELTRVKKKEELDKV